MYTVGMANKKRVNITIDPDVHSEIQKFLDVADLDFSGFVEMIAVRFLSGVRPLNKRMEEVNKLGLAPSRAEIKVMFLEMFATAQMDLGQVMGEIMDEIDIVEGEKRKEGTPALFPVPASTEFIHTPKVTKSTKAKK